MDAVETQQSGLNSASQKQGKVFSNNTDWEQKARWWQGRKGWKGENQMLGSKMPPRSRMAAFSGSVSKSVV